MEASKPETKAPRAKIANKKPTLGSMFKNSLIELMKTINSTNVHYIRCIKPNEQKKAWEFDTLMVLSQLRACGVLETIRISCAGFLQDGLMWNLLTDIIFWFHHKIGLES